MILIYLILHFSLTVTYFFDDINRWCDKLSVHIHLLKMVKSHSWMSVSLNQSTSSKFKVFNNKMKIIIYQLINWKSFSTFIFIPLKLKSIPASLLPLERFFWRFQVISLYYYFVNLFFKRHKQSIFFLLFLMSF